MPSQQTPNEAMQELSGESDASQEQAQEDHFNKKIRVLKLSPDLADGEHWTVATNKKELLDAMAPWLDEFYSGDQSATGSFTVEVHHMTQYEIDTLPGI